MSDQDPDILDLDFFCNDLGKDLTIRGYLKELIKTLWQEGEGFSGKRPFGNGVWRNDIYATLIREGVVPGKLDWDGFVETIDNTKMADALILDAISRM